MEKYCVNCGAKITEDQDVCLKCGRNLKNVSKVQSTGKSKVAAGLLALFFGVFGVHNFYLGYNSKGATQLVLTIVGFILCIVIIGIFMVVAVEIWAFVEAIMIFCGNIKDADGNELIN